MQDVSREQMGAYLCIASNKVPPSVSKRIKLIVECKFYISNSYATSIDYFFPPVPTSARPF